MELIKDTVQSVFENLTRRKGSAGGDNPEAWVKKTLTKRELRHIKCNYFKKGVLGIGVDSSSWLYYFNLKKEVLLKQLTKQSGQIKGIHFYLGEAK